MHSTCITRHSVEFSIFQCSLSIHQSHLFKTNVFQSYLRGDTAATTTKNIAVRVALNISVPRPIIGHAQDSNVANGLGWVKMGQLTKGVYGLKLNPYLAHI